MFESLDEQMKRDDNLVGSDQRAHDALRFVRSCRPSGLRRVDFRGPFHEVDIAGGAIADLARSGVLRQVSTSLFHRDAVRPKRRLRVSFWESNGKAPLDHVMRFDTNVEYILGSFAIIPHNAAVAGEALSMYTTRLADCGVIPPQIAVGGQLAEVLYSAPPAIQATTR